jgi:putative tricarboxylic transport membrane protein
LQRHDRIIGLLLTLLGAAVFVSARSFPNVPGQKLGAATLPLVVAAGLMICGVALVARGWREARGAGAPGSQRDRPARSEEHFGAPLVILASIAVYVALSEPVGYLLVAPLSLLIGFRALRVRWGPAIGWSVAVTAFVHLAFYKLLKVPLPWGIVHPFY